MSAHVRRAELALQKRSDLTVYVCIMSKFARQTLCGKGMLNELRELSSMCSSSPCPMRDFAL